MKTEVREKLRVALLMAMSSGFMDGYTFFHYDERFAGAQTGNVMQAGIYLAQGNIVKFWDFAIPIFFFMAGVIFKVFYSNYLVKRGKFDALYMLSVQLVGLTVFAVLYGSMYDTFLRIPNSIFVGILSFFMAIQFDTFNRAHGLGYTSVFTTGNIKNFSVSLAQWFLTKDKKYLHAVRVLGAIIPTFFIGAFLATVLGNIFGVWTLLGVCVIYFIVFVIYRTENI
ncbi:YoaK family protein [Lactococcus fujiensis]|uniref:DUF1275 domain-containing protein n=2 Tax=Lactococcus fujiensis TaxID=610251 RepID=A0A2A5RJN1_9LACT|nr:YoaK family protein [Lactococcus fujiensis]PCR99329.1 hypothetical protein RT41_GL001970 [Lactococcus fujiensis JCM 16395]